MSLKMADCDDLAVCSKLEKTVKNTNVCVSHLHILNSKKTTTKKGTSKFKIEYTEPYNKKLIFTYANQSSSNILAVKALKASNLNSAV